MLTLEYQESGEKEKGGGPNAESRAAIAEADQILRSHGARFQTASELFNDLEKNGYVQRATS